MRSSQQQKQQPAFRDPEVHHNAVVYKEDSEDFKASNQPRYARVTALLLGLTALLGMGIGVYYFMQSNDLELKKDTSLNANFQGTVAMASIIEHDIPDDCWMAIRGNVYDMTEYAPLHPGNPTLITRHCGTDATRWYDLEHSVALLPIVDPYLLGTLVEESEAITVDDGTEDASGTTTMDSESESEDEAPPTPTRLPTSAPVQQSSPTARPTAALPAPTPNPTAASTGCPMERYTVADIANHADENSCWYGLYGVVYDFTDYIDDHKGGRGTILADCGTDATVNFENEKKHDVALLEKKGFASMIIGRQGLTRGIEYVPCDEVELVAVNLP